MIRVQILSVLKFSSFRKSVSALKSLKFVILFLFQWIN